MTVDELRPLVGKRVLVRNRYITSKIEELTILEVAKGPYVKVEYVSGNTQWVDSNYLSHIELVEELCKVNTENTTPVLTKK